VSAFVLAPEDRAQVRPELAAAIAVACRRSDSMKMPIEQPSRYELFIHLKTAKAIGVTIGRALLLRADEVVK
jgi:putative ABC transport system substrate-binding protein